MLYLRYKPQKMKWFLLCTYKPLHQNNKKPKYSNIPLSRALDFYSVIYENDEFNFKPTVNALASFLEYYNRIDLIKGNKCFEGNGPYINLILSNRNIVLKNHLPSKLVVMIIV